MTERKKHIRFYVDKKHYCFSFLPTIIWMPWKYSWHDVPRVDIWWLIFHVTIWKKEGGAE